MSSPNTAKVITPLCCLTPYPGFLFPPEPNTAPFHCGPGMALRDSASSCYSELASYRFPSRNDLPWTLPLMFPSLVSFHCFHYLSIRSLLERLFMIILSQEITSFPLIYSLLFPFHFLNIMYLSLNSLCVFRISSHTHY